MKIISKPFNSFFAALAFMTVLATNGCTSVEAVAPLEDAQGDEELYFWGGMKGDEKIYLNLDSFRHLYRLENAADADEIIGELKSRSPKLQIQVMPLGLSYFLLASRSNTSVIFPESKKIKFQIPVYTTKRTGFTYFFDGRIMLKPREGVTIEEILDQKSGIKLLDKLSSGIHFLAVEEGEKVLTIANQIYESGLVEACLPNYRAPIAQH